MIRLKNKNTNEVREFENANRASIELNISRAGISYVVNGKRKSVNGWILVNNENVNKDDVNKENVNNDNVNNDNVNKDDINKENVNNENVNKENVNKADFLNQIEELKQENERLTNELNQQITKHEAYKNRALELKAEYLLLRDKVNPDLLNQIEQLKKEKEKIQTALDIELGWQDRNNTNELESKTNIVEEVNPKVDNTDTINTINTDTVNTVQNEAVKEKYIHDSSIDEFDFFEEEETQINTIVANEEEEKEKDDITQTLLSKLGKREDKEEAPKTKTVYKGNNDFSDFESEKDLDFWQFSGNFPNLRW